MMVLSVVVVVAVVISWFNCWNLLLRDVGRVMRGSWLSIWMMMAMGLNRWSTCLPVRRWCRMRHLD